MLRPALLGAAADLPGPAWLLSMRLSVLLPGGYDLLVRPVLALLDPVALHLLAVAALLPTAVLLEARDLRRSWQLLHGSWRPTVRIVLVVPAPAALNRALNRALPGPLPGLVLEAVFAVLLFGCRRDGKRDVGQPGATRGQRRGSVLRWPCRAAGPPGDVAVPP
ncbi:hypothetical protein [Kitasatospora cineracea]|uniref:Uncharacterized protein n=1 Tax=Kitasatospora cineracea TaxID=88074 RepID=A0A8G1UGJ5_9ACTN|nr:hypothetical protein [Kitasatospora cineracea]ROR37896.1 hypothetical protein EDD39_6054 [Kitasatospora cineracea]